MAGPKTQNPMTGPKTWKMRWLSCFDTDMMQAGPPLSQALEELTKISVDPTTGQSFPQMQGCLTHTG
jgi:hypothetical protein